MNKHMRAAAAVSVLPSPQFPPPPPPFQPAATSLSPVSARTATAPGSPPETATPSAVSVSGYTAATHHDRPREARDPGRRSTATGRVVMRCHPLWPARGAVPRDDSDPSAAQRRAAEAAASRGVPRIELRTFHTRSELFGIADSTQS